MRHLAKRFSAGLMLVSIAATVMPLPPHERMASADCHPSTHHVAALSVGSSPLSECDHGPGTACATMLGCVVLPSALASVAARFNAAGATTVVALFSNGALHGRLSLGPPTPPPNS